MTEGDVLKALRPQWDTDKYVLYAQCKNGPTWFTSGLRVLDALAVRKSWVHQELVGFEIKTSRSDFTGDDKWPDYYQLCHRFYWVCPRALIKPQEIDAKAGLIWINAEGVAHTRKRALVRKIEMPENLLWYLLICRETRDDRPQSDKEFWRDWLEGRRDDHDVGYRVRVGLPRRVGDLAQALERERARFKDYDEALREFNITSHWQLRERLAYTGGKMSPMLMSRLRSAAEQTLAALDKIKVLQEENEQ